MSQATVLFFGRLADLVSEPETKVPIAQGVTTEELYIKLASKNPALPSRETDSSIKVAINQTLGSWNDQVKDGDEIAFLPPVTGG